MQNAVDIERARVGGSVHSLTLHLQRFDCTRGKCNRCVWFPEPGKEKGRVAPAFVILSQWRRPLADECAFDNEFCRLVVGAFGEARFFQ